MQRTSTTPISALASRESRACRAETFSDAVVKSGVPLASLLTRPPSHFHPLGEGRSPEPSHGGECVLRTRRRTGAERLESSPFRASVGQSLDVFGTAGIRGGCPPWRPKSCSPSRAEGSRVPGASRRRSGRLRPRLDNRRLGGAGGGAWAAKDSPRRDSRQLRDRFPPLRDHSRRLRRVPGRGGFPDHHLRCGDRRRGRRGRSRLSEYAQQLRGWGHAAPIPAVQGGRHGARRQSARSRERARAFHHTPDDAGQPQDLGAQRFDLQPGARRFELPPHPTRGDPGLHADRGGLLDVARRAFEEALRKVSGALAEPAPEAYINDLGVPATPGVNWQLRVWCNTEDYAATHQGALRAAKRVLDELRPGKSNQ